MHAISQNLKHPVALVLAAAILVMGVLSFFAMAHNLNEHDTCILASSAIDCSAPQNLGMCYEFQQKILRQLSLGIPFVKQFAVLLVVFALAALVVIAYDYLARDFLVIRQRLRMACDNAASRFYKQLGDWLSLFEKLDPALQFTDARQF